MCPGSCVSESATPYSVPCFEMNYIYSNLFEIPTQISDFSEEVQTHRGNMFCEMTDQAESRHGTERGRLC